MSSGRLQKVLARAGIASRRRVEEMIREGRISVNGRVAEIGDSADLEKDSVRVDGKRIHASKKSWRYVLLNKPAGYLSTVQDPLQRPTVLDLLPMGWRHSLKPVGRLDFDSEGLLLLTNDGDLALKVTHPRFGCTKTYAVKVKGRPQDEDLESLRRGIMLYGKRTAPVKIEARSVKGKRASASNSWWTVVLGEGKTRQIREMFQRIGHPVTRLKRVAIGPITDLYLPRGEWRELENAEVERLRESQPTAPLPAGARRGRRPANPVAKDSGRDRSPRKGKSPRANKPGKRR